MFGLFKNDKKEGEKSTTTTLYNKEKGIGKTINKELNESINKIDFSNTNEILDDTLKVINSDEPNDEMLEYDTFKEQEKEKERLKEEEILANKKLELEKKTAEENRLKNIEERVLLFKRTKSKYIKTLKKNTKLINREYRLDKENILNESKKIMNDLPNEIKLLFTILDPKDEELDNLVIVNDFDYTDDTHYEYHCKIYLKNNENLAFYFQKDNKIKLDYFRSKMININEYLSKEIEKKINRIFNRKYNSIFKEYKIDHIK